LSLLLKRVEDIPVLFKSDENRALCMKTYVRFASSTVTQVVQTTIRKIKYCYVTMATLLTRKRQNVFPRNISFLLYTLYQNYATLYKQMIWSC